MKIADAMLIGGGMAYTFFKAQGIAVGKSIVEADKLELASRVLADARARNFRLLLPSDQIAASEFRADAQKRTVAVGEMPDGWMGLDIGPETIKRFSAEIAGAKTMVWNGPMGVFEMPAFAQGTLQIAKAVATATSRGATSIIGGGDSVAAVQQAGLADKVSHISTGGGASVCAQVSRFCEDEESPCGATHADFACVGVQSRRRNGGKLPVAFQRHYI